MQDVFVYVSINFEWGNRDDLMFSVHIKTQSRRFQIPRV